MSYDIYIEADLGGDEPVDLGFDFNYTSNVAPMWRQAMPDTNGLAGFHGMLASEAAVVLEEGIRKMDADPDSYRVFNPENGWGDFEGQRRMLGEILDALKKAPQAKVRISR